MDHDVCRIDRSELADERMPEVRLIDDDLDGSALGLRWLLAAVLLLAIVGGGIDLWLDAPDSWWSLHVFYEVVLIAGAVASFVALWSGWWRARRWLAETRRALEEQRAERDAWRESARSALDGLGRAMDERFVAWGLTPAEREVALGLLKGRSHKVIAYESGRSERTVRQHAVAVYQKSVLGGRAELSAFFLEGVMLPEPSRSTVPTH
jgi:DNA-binding CsgD family transcriptional regulator